MKVRYLSLVLVVSSAKLCIGYVVPTAGIAHNDHQNRTLSENEICGPFSGLESFCQQCLHHGYSDHQTCIWEQVENRRFRDINPSMYITSTSRTSLSQSGTIYTLRTSIDSCVRLRWEAPVGPFQIRGSRPTIVSLQVIVREISSHRPEDAMAVVLADVDQGLQEVKAKFPQEYYTDLGQGHTGFQELEAGWRDANIKFLDAFVFNVIGGSFTWLAARALMGALTEHNASPNQDLANGAVATMALLTYIAIADWLREGLGKPVVLASIHWVLWLVQCAVSSMRLMLQHMQPLASRMNNHKIMRAIRNMDSFTVTLPDTAHHVHGGLVLPNIRVHTPDSCDSHVTQLRPSVQPEAWKMSVSRYL